MNDSRAGITDVFVLPDPRRQQLTVRIQAEGVERVALRIQDSPVAWEGTPGECILPFDTFEPWLPEAPRLHDLVCEAPESPDVPPFSVRFGMRECSLQENRFTINQRPVHLKGVALEPADIEQLANASAIEAYLRALHETGINWLTVPADLHSTPLIADVADALGVLVTVRFKGDDDASTRRTTIRRLQNHPSIFAWEWPRTPKALDIETLDPTRFFWCTESEPALGDAHAWLCRPRGAPAERFEPLDVRVIAPLSREAATFLRSAGTEDGISVVSVNGLETPGEGIEPPFDVASVEAVHADGIRTAIDSMRANPRVAGYRFEQALAPIDTRPPSTTRLAATRDAQAPMRIVIAAARASLTPRQDMDVEIRFLNEQREDGRADLSLQVVGPTNQVLWKKKRNVKLPRHGRELWSGTIAASGSTGTHTFVARLMGSTGRLAESRVPFHVVAPVKPRGASVDIVDPSGGWFETLRKFVPNIEAQAPLILIPSVDSTVKAYPDNLLGQALGRVREGAVAVVFSPPADWDELADAASADAAADALDLLDQSGVCAAALRHPVFDSLPAGVLGDTYRSVMPIRAFGGSSEDAIAPVVGWNDKRTNGHLVRVRRYGNGRLVFTSLRLLDRLDREPLAARIFLNLLDYSERRALSVPEVLPVERDVVEWIREQRRDLRRWWVIGPFGGNGVRDNETVFPPEGEFDPQATYAGWFRALTWHTVYLPREGEGAIEFQYATSPETIRARPLLGTFYALAEIHAETRRELSAAFSARGLAKGWLNGKPLDIGNGGDAVAPSSETRVSLPLRDGRNQLLFKVTAAGRDARLAVDLG